MADDDSIPKSSAPFRSYLIWSGLLVFAACCVVILFFFVAVSVAPTLQFILVISLWVGMTLLWMLSWFVTSKSSENTSYILTPQALVVEKKGWFGKVTRQAYRYDTIVSVYSTSRAHGSYGSVELRINHQQSHVTLHGVESPDKQVRRLKERIASSMQYTNRPS